MVADARAALFLATISLGLTACVGADSARGLDRICGTTLDGGPTCAIDGIGVYTTGLTEDSIGFSITDATLSVHLAGAVDLRGKGPFDISLLTVARFPGTVLDTSLTWGKCGKGCPPDPLPSSIILPTSYAWVTIATGIQGSTAAAEIPYDAVMSFASVEFDIVDLRIHATP